MNTKNLIHINLKPENILFFKNDTVKISDLDLSLNLSQNKEEN